MFVTQDLLSEASSVEVAAVQIYQRGILQDVIKDFVGDASQTS